MDILVIDTYSDTCGVAMLDLKGNRKPLVRTSDAPRSHAKMLAVFASELMQEAGSKPEGIAVVAGPGSYTGLRIGVSTAKGLAWSLNVPLYGISTLLYLAQGAGSAADGTNVVSFIKAREGEVFLGQFRTESSRLVRVGEDRAMNLKDAAELISSNKSGQVVISDDAPMLNALQNRELNTQLVTPNVVDLLPLLTNHLDDFRVNDQNSFEPSYLKEFVARKAATSIFDRLPF
ncbi:MAG: tRNA (adenosine(37)-N6)-threonylcarbamoyltransferase complex dimerization subunit type 1 TsaB [Bacteroidetes bacterium]|nr:tRNA (adenosine(37)-N6)-threonylcarbamoyltransferase complex dimerization subunit type 1 TsaB [Bacteroidota bacterium]